MTTYHLRTVPPAEAAAIADHYRTLNYLRALDVRCAAIRSSVAVHTQQSHQAALERSERAQSAAWAIERQAPRERATGTILDTDANAARYAKRYAPINGKQRRGTHITWSAPGAQYAPPKPVLTAPWQGAREASYLGLPARETARGRVLVTRSRIDLAAAEACATQTGRYLLALLARVPIVGPFGLLNDHATLVVAGATSRRNQARTDRRAVARDARPVLAREGLSDNAAAFAAIAGEGSWHLVNGGTLTREGQHVAITFADRPYLHRHVGARSTLTTWIREARKSWTIDHTEQAAKSRDAYQEALAHRPNVSALAD